MPKPNPVRFKLASRRLDPDARGDAATQVQRYLRRFGYLRRPVEGGRLDSPTQEALRQFQERANVPPTGFLDEATAAALERPRCGTPDLPTALGPLGEFVLRGCSYQGQFRTLGYAFVVGTADLPGASEKQAVRNAFATWQQQIPIDFVEVGVSNNPNFSIGWFAGDHGDGSPFDGTGNTLAHAFYPPPCGGAHFGKLHFDDAELWALADGANQFDTETVALCLQEVHVEAFQGD